MARLNLWMKTCRLSAALITGMVTYIVLGTAILGIAGATGKPDYCSAACHEMRLYESAWSAGPHKDVDCFGCHVNTNRPMKPGKELGLPVDSTDATWSASTRSTDSAKTQDPHLRVCGRFHHTARETRPDVPDSRCTGCHNDVKTDTRGFSHPAHAKNRPCALCHANTGHNVALSARLRAGISATKTAAAVEASAVVDGGTANLVDHVSVMCSRCHVMTKTLCTTCHTSKHRPRGECSVCHRPAPRFGYWHPKSGVDCASCHKLPGKHPDDSDCTTCHPSAGKNWKYAHKTNEARKTCADCHVRPAKHRQGDCESCHNRAGVNWAFLHPDRRSKCSSCHPRPNGHESGQCSSCHRRTGRNWAFSHSGASSRCSSCHQRPDDHEHGQCSSCHKRTRSWAYNHPRIRGGEHSSRSFACGKCHPGGYSSHSCTGCHDSDDEDEDD